MCWQDETDHPRKRYGLNSPIVLSPCQALPTESLDALTQLTAKLFSPILNRGQDPAPLITMPPLGKEELGVRLPNSCWSSYLTPFLDSRANKNSNGLSCIRHNILHTLAVTLLPFETGRFHRSFCRTRRARVYTFLFKE